MKAIGTPFRHDSSLSSIVADISIEIIKLYDDCHVKSYLKPTVWEKQDRKNIPLSAKSRNQTIQIRPLAFAVSSSCSGQNARLPAAFRSDGHVRRSVYVRTAFGVRMYDVRCTCVRRSMYAGIGMRSACRLAYTPLRQAPLRQKHLRV